MRSILFHIGPFSIYSYGLLVALGVLAGIAAARAHAQKAGISQAQSTDMILFVTLAGFVGARILYVVMFWEEYRGRMWAVLKVWEGGLIYYGGLIAALLALFIYTRLKRTTFLKLTDLLFPSLALAQCFGRLGCLMNGCCYGRPTTLPWAMRFPFLSETVHPTQLYEAGFLLVVFFVLFRLHSKSQWQGQTSLWYFVLYPLGRFGIEFLRGDHVDYFLGLTLSQWISLGLLGLAIIGFAILRKRFPYVVSSDPRRL